MSDVLSSLLGALKKLPPNRWRCTVDGTPKGPVTGHDVGLDKETAYTTFNFKVDQADHVLKAERNVAGGDTVIQLDGAAMPDPRLDIYPTTYGITMQIVVKCQFTVSGKTTEYRFDGRMWP